MGGRTSMANPLCGGTNVKFKKRFAYIDQGAKKQGRNLSELSLEEMDAFWSEAKKMEW